MKTKTVMRLFVVLMIALPAIIFLLLPRGFFK